MGDVNFLSFDGGTGDIRVTLSLKNDLGDIPSMGQNDNLITTGISVGKIRIYGPNGVIETTANGSDSFLHFYPNASSELNGSNVSFRGTVFWNGFTVPLSVDAVYEYGTEIRF